MKANKSFSLDMEIIEKLTKEDNPSKLLNELLHKHYNKSLEVARSLTPEQAEQAKALALSIKESKEKLRGLGYDI